MKINKEYTIISLSGSNPLSEPTMEHLRKSSVIVYIDVDKEEILKRCHKMKIDRVVGMSTKTFEEIFDFRRDIYQKHYDFRVIVGNSQTVEEIAQNVKETLERHKCYLDLGNGLCIINSFDHIYDEMNAIPKSIPYFKQSQLARLVNMDSKERLIRIFENFSLGNIRPQEISLLFSANENNTSLSILDKGIFKFSIFHNKLYESKLKVIPNSEKQFIIDMYFRTLYLIECYLFMVKVKGIELGKELDLSISGIGAKDLNNLLQTLCSFVISKKMGVPFKNLNLIFEEEEFNYKIGEVLKTHRKDKTISKYLDKLMYLISPDKYFEENFNEEFEKIINCYDHRKFNNERTMWMI
jgi:hypothetical protein